jgi:DNA-binding FrmR family transcriptional regulator
VNEGMGSQAETLLNRLRRVEGQIRGIQRMLEEGRECEDVLTQLVAARSALDRVGLLLMDWHIERCLLGDLPSDEPRVQVLREALKTWTRFGLLPGAAEDLPT